MDGAQPIPPEERGVPEPAERFLVMQGPDWPRDNRCSCDVWNRRCGLHAELVGEPNIHGQQRNADPRAFLQGIVGFVGAVVRRVAFLGDEPGADPDAAADDAFGEDSPPAWQVGICAAGSGLAAGRDWNERHCRREDRCSD